MHAGWIEFPKVKNQLAIVLHQNQENHLFLRENISWNIIVSQKDRFLWKLWMCVHVYWRHLVNKKSERWWDDHILHYLLLTQSPVNISTSDISMSKSFDLNSLQQDSDDLPSITEFQSLERLPSLQVNQCNKIKFSM